MKNVYSCPSGLTMTVHVYSDKNISQEELKFGCEVMYQLHPATN